LPEYFGFESSIVDYCDCARRPAYTTYAAIAEDDRKIGFSMLVMNNEMTAQIWVMGVMPEFHRQGVGRLLLEETEQGARALGRQYILAKTIGPSQNDSNFARTFNFYCKNGYTMVAEIADHIWGGSHCALMVKKL
jgi:GNAT superfamily N-acetyltransferase